MHLLPPNGLTPVRTEPDRAPATDGPNAPQRQTLRLAKERRVTSEIILNGGRSFYEIAMAVDLHRLYQHP